VCTADVAALHARLGEAGRRAAKERLSAQEREALSEALASADVFGTGRENAEMLKAAALALRGAQRESGFPLLASVASEMKGGNGFEVNRALQPARQAREAFASAEEQLASAQGAQSLAEAEDPDDIEAALHLLRGEVQNRKARAKLAGAKLIQRSEVLGRRADRALAHVFSFEENLPFEGNFSPEQKTGALMPLAGEGELPRRRRQVVAAKARLGKELLGKELLGKELLGKELLGRDSQGREGREGGGDSGEGIGELARLASGKEKEGAGEWLRARGSELRAADPLGEAAGAFLRAKARLRRAGQAPRGDPRSV
jgi:hypothetical protein